jgi:cytochrome b
MRQAMIPVWDRLVRLLHWGVALLVLWNFLNEDGSPLHRYAGYGAVALVLLRLVWGCVSGGHAHFSRWWPGMAGILAYLRATLHGAAPRHLGINPAGAAMAAAIWILVLALGLSGWMMRWDMFWGEEWLDLLHALLSDLLLACVALHVLAVLAMSLHHRENLPKAMITGKKRAP